MSMARLITMDYRKVTLEEGIAVVRDRDGEHVPYTGKPIITGDITPGEHWTGKWLSRDNGVWAVLVIKPVSREARKLVREHYIKQWGVEHSISRDLANKIYQMNIPFKRELIGDICAAMNDAGSHAAFMEYQGDSYQSEWEKAYPDLVRLYCKHNRQKNDALIEAIKSLLLECAATL